MIINKKLIEGVQNMSVITVCGNIDEGKLGVTLTHEHLLIDTSKLFKGIEITEISKKNLFYEKVCISNLGEVKKNPLLNMKVSKGGRIIYR